MTLKSSESKNFLSWWVSTKMKSFLVSSAFCHCTLPFHQTNVENSQIRTEDIPLFSRIQSLHHLLEVDDHDEEEYSIVLTLGNRLANKTSGSTSVHFLSPMGKVFVDGLARIRLCGCALAFDLLAKAGAFDFNAKLSNCILKVCFLLVVVVLLHVAQVRDQLFQVMRNYDPRVRIVFVYRSNPDFHSMFTLKVNGCDFQYGLNFGVPSNPTFRVRWFFIFWQSVLTTSHLICKLWEFLSVFCDEALSDINRCQESCISTKLNHTVLSWKLVHSLLVLWQ